MNPDKALAGNQGIVASSDGKVIDAVQQWFCLARHVIESHLPAANVIRFAD